MLTPKNSKSKRRYWSFGELIINWRYVSSPDFLFSMNSIEELVFFPDLNFSFGGKLGVPDKNSTTFEWRTSNSLYLRWVNHDPILAFISIL